jgi:hypothetical protein
MAGMLMTNGVVNVSAVIATASNAEGRREIVGFDIVTTEDTAAWTAFLRSPVARGLSGVELVISDGEGGPGRGSVFNRWKGVSFRPALTSSPDEQHAWNSDGPGSDAEPFNGELSKRSVTKPAP